MNPAMNGSETSNPKDLWPFLEFSQADSQLATHLFIQWFIEMAFW